MVQYVVISSVPGYRVGSDGSVWTNLKRVGLGNGGGVKYVDSLTWTLMKPTANRYGALYVRLRGIRKYVHHLVLEAFVGPKPEGQEACHFPDSNPSNNCLANLRWGTKQENESDKVIHGTNNAGTRNGNAVLTDQKVRYIRNSTLSTRLLALKLNITERTVRKVKNGECWKHVV